MYNFSYNNVAKGINILFIQEKMMQVRAFEKIYPLNALKFTWSFHKFDCIIIGQDFFWPNMT